MQNKNNRGWFLIILLVLFVVSAGLLYYIITNGGWGNQENSSTTQAEIPVAKEKVVLSMIVDLSKNFYPFCETDSYNGSLAGNVLDGLVAFDKDSRIVPNLATKWDNPDNNTWRFYLNPKAKFSDGTTVTADDIKASWDFIQNGTPIKDLLPAVEQVKVVDTSTVSFITKAPNPILVNRLANNFLVMSKKDLEANKKVTIGSGPYKLVSYSSTNVVLTRSDNYWKTMPLVKNVEFKTIPDEADRIKALLAGEVDFAIVANTTNLPVTQALKGGKILNQNSSRYNATDMLVLDTNRDKTPNIPLDVNPLKNLKVRQALYQAIDIKAEIAASSPADLPATQVVPKGIFGYNPNITRLEYDPVVAKKLLTDAGYPAGFEVTIDASKIDRTVAAITMIAKQWEVIGVKVNINLVAKTDDFYALIDARKTSIYRSGYTSDSKDANEVLSEQFHTTAGDYGPYNLSYSNIAVDKLIEDADQNLNQKTRLSDMQQAAKLLADDVAFIPLGESYDSYLYTKDILWTPRADGRFVVSELAGRGTN